MKRMTKLLFLLLLLFSVTSCDNLVFHPYDVLPGSYVHKVAGADITDLFIELRPDGTCTVVKFDENALRTDIETTYTSSCKTFSYEMVIGYISIKDVGEFEYRWYSDRNKFLKMELIDIKEKKKYTMVYGSLK